MSREWFDDMAELHKAERELHESINEYVLSARPTATETDEPGCPCVPGTP